MAYGYCVLDTLESPEPPLAYRPWHDRRPKKRYRKSEVRRLEAEGRKRARGECGTLTVMLLGAGGRTRTADLALMRRPL